MFFLVIFFSILLIRSNLYLLGNEILNIDESQMTANAIKLSINKFNILEFDGTSSGFLNSLILTWPDFFGLDITILTTRLTAIVVLALIFYIIFLYFNISLSNKTIAAILVLPGLLFFSFTQDPDFQHYSSELLSTLFIVFAIFVNKLNLPEKKIFYNFLGITGLSLILFSKTQLVPTSVIIFLFICLSSLWKKDFFQLVINSFIFTLPIFFILSIYYFNGYLEDYYINYFEFPKAVISKYSIEYNVLQRGLSSNNINSNLFNHLIFNSISHYFYFQIIISIILIVLSIIRKNYHKLLNFNFLLIIISIISIFSSIIITGAVYRHYFIPLVPLTTLFVGYLLVVNIKEIKRLDNLKIIMIFFMFLLLLSYLTEEKKFYAKNIKTKLNLKNINLLSPRVFNYLDIEKGSLYVWGWAPQLYSLSYLYPVDRATISQKNIEDYSNNEYFNQRLLNEIYNNKPDIIIDAVKPKSFYYTNIDLSLKNLLPLKKIIDLQYYKINKSSSDCLDIFIKIDNYKKLKQKLINYSMDDLKIKSKIDDFSVIEELCENSFIFDTNYTDELELSLESNSIPKKIMILPSIKNKDFVKVKIKLVDNDNKIYLHETELRKYPYWNEIAINEKNKFINKIIIDLTEIKKLNFGINEIKIFR